MAVALTTVDNPYHPIHQFDLWYAHDERKGYHTCQYLDNIARTSSQMSSEEYEEAIEAAIDEIVHYDILNRGYIKVTDKTNIADWYRGEG